MFKDPFSTYYYIYCLGRKASWGLPQEFGVALVHFLVAKENLVKLGK